MFMQEARLIMDLDDFAKFWNERTIIINNHGKAFNQYLHNINAPVMTMQEYERAFRE